VELRRIIRADLAPQLILAPPRSFAERIATAPRDRFDRAVVAIVFIAANTALLVTAPHAGDFWWSDAPRHALNGIFVKDFAAAAPWHDPKTWAINYYLQYPALTILFYPPLFYCFEAITFAIFGVSQLAAQAAVSLFTVVLGAATYGFMRLWDRAGGLRPRPCAQRADRAARRAGCLAVIGLARLWLSVLLGHRGA
jgi:hypothetical protein